MKGARINKIFGIILIVFGGVAILAAILLAIGSVAADQKGAEKNEAEWKEYNEWLEQVVTAADSTEVEALIAERDKPVIRQGGFASAFGIFFALCIIAIAAIPLIVGIVLIGRYKRKKREIQLLNNNYRV